MSQYMQTYLPYNYQRQDMAPAMGQPMGQIPQMAQMQQMPQPAQAGPPGGAPSFCCRPVTSREEAVAMLADYFSLGTVMPDLAHGVIYLKRFNANTGGSDFYTFALQAEVIPQRDIQETLLQEIMALRETIAQIQAESDRPRRARKAAEDVPDEY